jgi:hypothetical protein
MAGYSEKTLPAKLGIKEAFSVVLLNQPKNYLETLGKLPDGTTISDKLTPKAEFIQAFYTKQTDFEEDFPKLKTNLAKNGTLWISWPKKAAKMVTDLDENVIREFGLTHGLVDVKVAAIDEIWSGLKFVYRLTDR